MFYFTSKAIDDVCDSSRDFIYSDSAFIRKRKWGFEDYMVHITFNKRKTLQNNIDTHLKNSTARNIIINLDEVTYIDSTGIGTLISIRQIISGARGELRLIHVTNSVKKIFELTKLNMLFKILDDEEAAIATF